MTANQAKTQFGELIMTAQREPVSVTKNGRPKAVVMSQEAFDEMKEALNQAWWDRLFPTEEATKTLSAYIDKCLADSDAGKNIPFEGDIDAMLNEYAARKR